MFDEKIKFKFPWRPYQERVLKETEKYIKDKKIHIVAAPGSGKTVLGIELARRLKSPVIIFSPTVTIKNQWIDRFITSFTDFKEIPDWVSNNIYDLKFFNVATYQALHYVYKRKNIKVEDEEETDDVITDLNDNVVENVKVNEYDIISEIQKKNIKTIILDEAHHLKSEWWNSLNKVLNSLEDITIISLTATPPYDSEASEWKKYISLCGEIDAEISVPELVKVNNLCPHQDYIFFNKPTKEEKIELSKYENELKNKIEEIKRDDKLLNSIKNHKYILKPNYYEEELLENVEYYSSMLIYLNYRNEVINKNNLNIIGAKSKIPELTDEWLEILLKNLVLLDRENHDEGVVSKYEKEFRKLGVLDKNKFSFSDNKLLQKCFLNSLGKLNSISEIVKVESESLKEELRMVILTDFIRKEYMEAETEANKLGVFSIFNKLSKEYPK